MTGKHPLRLCRSLVSGLATLLIGYGVPPLRAENPTPPAPARATLLPPRTLAPDDPPPARPPAPDPEALRQIIRDEIQAEQNKATKQAQEQPTRRTKADKADEKQKEGKSEWVAVGKNPGLSATWNNGLVAETADKAFRIHVGGRLEFDNSWFTQDDNLLLGSSPDQRLLDGTLMRRARLRADGLLWEFIDFVTEVNFANIQDVSNVQNDLVQVGSVGLADFYLAFRDLPLVGNARFGHFQGPVGLDRDSSANAWYYMERSSLFDAFLGPNNRQNGVLLFDSYLDDRVSLAGCLAWVNKATVQSFGFGAFETGQYAVSGRATALPVYRDDGRVLMHVGAGFQHQALTDNTFVVANRPLLRAGAGNGQTPNVVSTGIFFSPHGATIVDLEWAAVCGPLSLSAEYAVVWGGDVFERFDGVTHSGPRGQATYQAAYLEAGWFVTPGDHRRYDRKRGFWARTVPQENAFLARGEDGRWCRGSGAVQLLARYTYLDLVSGSPVLTPTSGGARAGRQHGLTLGATWYINAQTWVMLNYVWTHIDSVAPGASGDFHGIGCRLHLDF